MIAIVAAALLIGTAPADAEMIGKSLSVLSLNKQQTQAVVMVVNQAKADGVPVDAASNMQIRDYADGSIVVAFLINTIEKDGKAYRVWGSEACPTYQVKYGTVTKLVCLSK